jgi:hypothetical protein
MDDLKQLNTLINQIYKLSNKIETQGDTNVDLLNKNILLKEELAIKIKDLDDIKNKYDRDINIKNNELKEKCEELKNFTKVSFVQALNKQLNDKNLIIQQLEKEILKLKIKESDKQTIEFKEIKHFDPNHFEDINGYELTSYKKKYYLRDLETNELYNIVNNKPDKIIGLLSSKGKIIFS